MSIQREWPWNNSSLISRLPLELGTAQLIERWIRDQKLAVSSPSEKVGDCSSPELTFCAVRTIHASPQGHKKDPSHSARSAGGTLHVSAS